MTQQRSGGAGFGADLNKQFFVGSSYKKYATVATVALLAG